MKGIHIIESNSDYNVFTLGDLRDNPFVGLQADYIIEYNAGYYLLFNFINNQTELSLDKLNYTFSHDQSNMYNVTIPMVVAGFPVTQIGEEAFKDRKSLKEINIPKTVNQISAGCFAGCSNLDTIIIEEGNSYYDSRNNCNAIIQKEDNVLIAGCRRTIIPDAVTEISKYAFCGSLFTQINIPSSVSRIGDYAFSECKYLTHLEIPESVIEIGDAAFNECRELKIINIPHSITRIGNETFANCRSITDLTIPESVTELGDDAFYKCKKLNGLVLPSSITKIGNKAFYNCENIISLTIPETVTEIGDGVFCKCTNLKKINIPKSVTHIGYATFMCCEHLTSLILPDFITEIGDESFSKCTDLQTINLPNSINRIGSEAFADCKSLSAITIPESVTDIGKSAFDGCESLTEIIIPSKITIINDGTFRFCRRLVSVVLPDSINEIGEYAFCLCEQLKTISIPKSVTKIRKSAFYACVNLTEIVIPESVTEIEESTFYECDNIKEFNIPNSVTKIDKAAFVYCKSLTNIKIPKSVVEIGEHILWGCYNLKTITVDKKNVFYDSRENCNAIIETATNKLIKGCYNTVIPNSIQIIGCGAFARCKNLDGIVIPSSVTTIEDSAFYECSSLKEIVIPYSVKIIGSKAFAECENLKKITISNISLLNKEVGIPENATIEYSYGDLEEYLKNNSFDESPNAEHVKLVAKIPFTKIINSFADKLYETNPRYYNKALLSSIIDNTNYLMHINFGFIKYIHIYNHIGKNQVGSINLYIDFTQEKITDQRNDVCASNMIFDDYSLIYFLQNNYMALMGGIIVECCKSSNYGVLDTKYYPVINANPYYGNDKFSPYIKEFFKIKDNEKLSNDLDSLFTFSKSDENVLTNYYFLGNYGEKLDRDYSLWANIGVDRTNVTNKECIKAFLETFRQFLNAISTNLQSGGVVMNERRNDAIESAISKSDIRSESHNLGSHVYPRFAANNYSEDEINMFIQSYCGYRSNYLGEKTFGAPAMQTTKLLYKDIIQKFEQQKILLDLIPGVSNFKSVFRLEYNGQPFDCIKDKPVIMPADIFGVMAFYNIIENIIRNTAKHSRNKSGDGTTFTIEISDNKKDVPSTYYCVEIDNGVKEDNIDELVSSMNTKINESILDKKTFKLRDHNLGLVEISTAAAFLRKLDAISIDSFDYRFDNDDDNINKEGNLIILKAINKNGALGYRFFILKPQELLFVGKWENIQNHDKFLYEGIEFVNESVFSETLNHSISYPHQFVIYEDSVSLETKQLLSDDEDYKTLLPIRKLQVSSVEAKEIADIFNNVNIEIVDSLIEYAWTHYYKGCDEVLIGSNVFRKKTKSNDQIVFLNHGVGERLNANLRLKEDHELWIDNLSSYTQSKLPGFAELSRRETGEDKNPLQIYLDNINEQIRLELAEAYRNKVLILDERIQEFAEHETEGSSDETSGPIPCSALFASTNILYPKTNLAPNEFSNESKEAIEQFVNENICGSFLLVHYGVLERIYNDEIIIKNKLKEWSKKAKRVVVTSGRGSHSLPLPSSVCFANLSSLLYACKENRNKYLLNYLLYQSRRKHE